MTEDSISPEPAAAPAPAPAPGPTPSPAAPPAAEAPAFNRLKDCRHGRLLYNVNDAYVGRSLDLYGEFSEGEIDLFRQFLRPGDVVLDVGANIGAHTVWFARAVGLAGAVLAFEPQRFVFQALCANVALNSLMNVWCHPKALGETDGTIRVPLLDPRRPNNFGGLSLEHRGAGARTPPSEPVEMIRGDGLPLQRCRLIKVDVEGMELPVLKGLSGTIQRLKPALYVENDRPQHSAELIRYIDSIGYDAWWHKPPLFNPDNFFKNPQNVFGRIVSGNMLCMPRSAGASLQGFQKVEVPPAP